MSCICQCCAMSLLHRLALIGVSFSRSVTSSEGHHSHACTNNDSFASLCSSYKDMNDIFGIKRYQQWIAMQSCFNLIPAEFNCGEEMLRPPQQPLTGCPPLFSSTRMFGREVRQLRILLSPAVAVRNVRSLLTKSSPSDSTKTRVDIDNLIVYHSYKSDTF